MLSELPMVVKTIKQAEMDCWWLYLWYFKF
jgi:hypothetical protein